MTTQLLGLSPAYQSSPSHQGFTKSRYVRGLLAGVAGLALIGASATAAYAAPGDISADTTIANVEVTTAIELSGLTPTFTLVGVPGATVDGEGEVTMTVTTNNLAGYNVTVQSATATLIPTASGNTDSIPIGNLHVREHVAGDVGDPTPFTSLSSGTPVIVHSQAVRSVTGGDDLVNDYSVDIPFVNEDTYTATLNYVATTL